MSPRERLRALLDSVEEQARVIADDADPERTFDPKNTTARVADDLASFVRMLRARLER